MNVLDTLTGLAAARRAGKPYGIPSICSAHPVVVRAAARRAAREQKPVLIEATCNQVNQLGGYTGMTPSDFVRFVSDIAQEEGLDPARILFGGDHLGPNPWRKQPMEEAFAKADAMVDAYVRAGFAKIHLDASMGCAGEPAALDDETTARRAARLAKVAERAAQEEARALPLYIIGTEVPVPGGADHAIADLQPTSASAAQHTIAVHGAVFAEEGLGEAFDRVIAVVVQPGVEFGNANVAAFRPELAAPLTALLDAEPGLVFEAHSTDYQSRDALAALVQRGFPILKVGPGLTFALREALYGLDLIASELVEGYGDRSLKGAMEQLMLAEPADWRGHYHGTAAEERVARHYSYSDRIRYYWGRPAAEAAVRRLIGALEGVPVPETLMAQFLPPTSAGLGRAGDPKKILVEAVDHVIADYDEACESETA